jgi:HSP20 family protein
MFGRTRWTPFDDIFNFQRDADRLFSQFWNELPARTARAGTSFQVYANDDEWKVEIPLPGIDPQHVTLEVAGHSVSLRVQEPEQHGDRQVTRLEQTFSVPQFLDLDRMTASHRHGMLVLTLPIQEAVKPRRIEIGVEAGETKENKQLTAA